MVFNSETFMGSFAISEPTTFGNAWSNAARICLC